MLYFYLAAISNTVGLIGVILLLLGFYFLNMNKLQANDLMYQGLNLSGAILILYSLFFHWNTASVVIEIAWILISLVGIYRGLKNQNISNAI